MIWLLDTNVLSEIARPAPNDRVRRWVDAIAPGNAWISSVTEAEVRLGIELMPDGRKKQQVAGLTLATLRSFADACAPFDALAAVEFAAIVAARRRIGRTIGYADAQIAAIARSAGLVLATRNIRDFSDIEGLKLIDPWADPPHEPVK